MYIRTGVEDDLVTDIARGLNTGMQVAPKSIYNIDGVFAWLKKEVAGKSYGEMIAWRESDSTAYNVRDLISVLEMFNIIDFPNNVSKHPISAYEKWSIPLKKFADDFEENRKKLKNSKYYRLGPILHEALMLYDHIRHDFRDIHNESGGSAGKMNIVEEASGERLMEFPFGQLTPGKYRLTKGASYPIWPRFAIWSFSMMRAMRPGAAGSRACCVCGTTPVLNSLRRPTTRLRRSVALPTISERTAVTGTTCT